MPLKEGVGKPISGLDAAAKVEGVKVFHAGTVQRDGRIVTSGGRVLGVTALAPTLDMALDRCYQAAAAIHFDGMYYRKDIGRRALVR